MSTTKPKVDKILQAVLSAIEREREREIITRRFGLNDRKETLEQIGELLGITRERVRQLEKAVLNKLKAFSAANRLGGLVEFQNFAVKELNEVGGVAKLSDLSQRIIDDGRVGQARVAFLASLSPQLLVIDEDDHFFQSVAVSKQISQKKLADLIGDIIKAIENIGEPVAIEDVAKAAKEPNVQRVKAAAGISKQLAELNNRWGLTSWPMVNPKNIRDKIYVILKEAGRHMHFSEIAEAIKKSSFRRNDVTTQAIHNELIKDKRFVLIGRGIYALKEWGYQAGTVADIISQVLKKEGKPLHRDEIVKRVLKSRFVKETTILLNLQGKPQFKRVAKATYDIIK